MNSPTALCIFNPLTFARIQPLNRQLILQALLFTNLNLVIQRGVRIGYTALVLLAINKYQQCCGELLLGFFRQLRVGRQRLLIGIEQRLHIHAILLLLLGQGCQQQTIRLGSLVCLPPCRLGHIGRYGIDNIQLTITKGIGNLLICLINGLSGIAIKPSHSHFC